MAASVRHFDKTGGVQISSVTFPDIIAGDTGIAEKFFVENNGDRDLLGLVATITQVGSNDGSTFLRFAAAVNTVVPPFNVGVSISGPGAGGVWVGTGTRHYVLTATNATGETTQSFQVSINVDDTTKLVTVTWDLPVGATNIRVYRSTTSGVFVTPALRAVLGQTTIFVDDGTAVGAGAPPADNTTAGPSPNYGTPPTLGTTPINIGTLKIGQQFAYWVNRIVPAGTSETGNPRVAQIRFDET